MNHVGIYDHTCIPYIYIYIDTHTHVIYSHIAHVYAYRATYICIYNIYIYTVDYSSICEIQYYSMYNMTLSPLQTSQIHLAPSVLNSHPLSGRHLQRRTIDHSWRGSPAPPGFWPWPWPRIPRNSKRRDLGHVNTPRKGHLGKDSVDIRGSWISRLIRNRCLAENSDCIHH